MLPAKFTRRTRFYYRHKAAGLCVDCSALAHPRRTRCALHGRIENLRAQLRYYKKLLEKQAAHNKKEE